MRLFLAVEIPGGIRRALAEVQASLRPRLPGWRWVRPDGIHLTLRFLGEVEMDWRVHEAAWRRAVAEVEGFDVEVGGSGIFPSPSRPRVLWVGVTEPTGEGRLRRLAASLEAAARELGFPPEARDFSPHLTLARAAPGTRPTAPSGIDVASLGTVPVREVGLVRSELLPGGARYTMLARFALAVVGASK